MDSQTHAKGEAGMLASLKFCEQCKGSIPETALHDGHALFIGKKPVHVDCLLKRSAALPILGVVLGLVGTGLGLYALATKGGGTAKAPTEAVGAAEVAERNRLAGEAAGAIAAKEVAPLKQQVADALQAQAALEAERKTAHADLQKRAEALGAATADLGARLAKAEEAMAQGAARLEALGALDGKFNALSQAITDLRKEVLKAKSPAPAPEEPAPGPK